MLRRKTFIEEQKKSAEGKLAARLELLKAKGMDDRLIQKDAKIKQIKAQIRKSKHQLGGIAAMETLAVEKADARARKAAAAKDPGQKPKKVKKAAAEE